MWNCCMQMSRERGRGVASQFGWIAQNSHGTSGGSLKKCGCMLFTLCSTTLYIFISLIFMIKRAAHLGFFFGFVTSCFPHPILSTHLLSSLFHNLKDKQRFIGRIFCRFMLIKRDCKKAQIWNKTRWENHFSSRKSVGNKWPFRLQWKQSR